MGDQLTRLHKLTRADCTTRNRRKAAALRASYDNLEERIAVLSGEEAAVRCPDLDGNQIMELLGIGPGRGVGDAYKFCSSAGWIVARSSRMSPSPSCWSGGPSGRAGGRCG